jgi:HEAT repeat protein
MAAVRCLAQVGAGRSDVQDHLISLLNDPYLLVQMAAVRALVQVGDERAVPALKKLAPFLKLWNQKLEDFIIYYANKI